MNMPKLLVFSINADEVNLDGDAAIGATSASGAGGNIELQAGDINMENQSEITAEAEGESGGGNININATNITAKKDSTISAFCISRDGGNITIDTETLLGLDNSDITANAVEGDGGNINITATSILGEQGNVLAIDPDGSQHFVRMFLMSHPGEEMCQSTVGRK